MKKIKILHVVFNLGLGGGVRTVQTFIAYRRKLIFEENVLCIGENGPRAKELKKLGSKVYISKPDIQCAEKILHLENPDILHIHFDGKGNDFLRLFVKVAKRKKVKIVLTNIFSYYDPLIDKMADQHLFKSKMMLSVKFKKNSGLTVLPFKKYKVLYNPVDNKRLQKYKMSDLQIKRMRLDLKIPHQAPVIGRVGRADVVKWGDLILDAFPKILQEIPDCRLVIRGLPKSRLKYIQSKPWRENVIILPESSDDREVMSTYQILDVYTHTSKIGEAFGNALNEAMFYRKPIITHSTPHCDNGQLEQVIHNSNGVIANNPASFAKAVVYLLNNDKIAKKMGLNGYNKVSQEYNPQAITRHLEKIYISLLPWVINIPLISKYFKKIKYIPTKDEIEFFPIQYYKALNTSFKTLITPYETFSNMFTIPKKLWWRVKDYHEFQSTK